MSQSAIINVMRAAVEKAGRALRRDFGEIEHLQVSKKGQGDFVTNADLRAEKILFEELSEARPGYGFLLEEKGIVEGPDKTHRWIIDPLDGTTNFMHGIPHFAISVALERDGTLDFSMAEAAASAGVSAAAPYRHFADKEELLRAVRELAILGLGYVAADTAAKHPAGSIDSTAPERKQIAERHARTLFDSWMWNAKEVGTYAPGGWWEDYATNSRYWRHCWSYSRAD